MKKEELFDALGDIDPGIIKEAKDYKKHGNMRWTRYIAAVACAAILFGALVNIPTLRKDRVEDVPNPAVSEVISVKAQYPKITEREAGFEDVEYNGPMEWMRPLERNNDTASANKSTVEGGYTALMKELLASGDENTVCSPLNIYIALSMLSEITDGNTRAQILAALKANDIESLRKNVSALWQSNYANDPSFTCLLANSLWLNNDVKYKEETLKRLAGDYFISSFAGTPGSEDFDKALREWTDENTGGLLSEYTKNMSIKPGTVLELLSTIYYKAQWVHDFSPDLTKKESFHGVSGDSSVEMMHKTEVTNIYKAKNFSSVGLSLYESGSMYFFLPNEGRDVNALLSDPEVMKAIRFDEADKNNIRAEVAMSVPKFKVSSKSDLMDSLKTLGIRDALDPSLADFTPLTTEKKGLYLSKADHAALLEIDEKGVTGAAYTELAITEGAPVSDRKESFVLDRPFMFMVTGRDGSVLFSGIVRKI